MGEASCDLRALFFTGLSRGDDWGHGERRPERAGAGDRGELRAKLRRWDLGVCTRPGLVEKNGEAWGWLGQGDWKRVDSAGESEEGELGTVWNGFCACRRRGDMNSCCAGDSGWVTGSVHNACSGVTGMTSLWLSDCRKVLPGGVAGVCVTMTVAFRTRFPPCINGQQRCCVMVG